MSRCACPPAPLHPIATDTHQSVRRCDLPQEPPWLKDAEAELAAQPLADPTPPKKFVCKAVCGGWKDSPRSKCGEPCEGFDEKKWAKSRSKSREESD
jgi:hypothetical protein